MKTNIDNMFDWMSDTFKLVLAVSFAGFIVLLPLVVFAASIKFLMSA